MFNTFTCTSVINSKFICTLFIYVMYLSQLLRDGVFIVFFFLSLILNPTQPRGVSSYLWLDWYPFLADWLSVLHLCFKFLCCCYCRWCFLFSAGGQTVGRCWSSQRQMAQRLRSPACRRWSTPGPRPGWRSRWWSWFSSAGRQRRHTGRLRNSERAEL